ncbi:MAG: class I fructose-bisphosphate aldolase [Nitrososphaeria archaeon]
MSETGKVLRMGGILKNDGRTLVIAIDHGMGGMTQGIEDMEDVVKKVIQGGADAVLLNLGIAKKLAKTISGKVGLVLSIPYDSHYVELAAKLGADAIKTTYFGPVPITEERMKQISAITLAAEEWGMPTMIEVVPLDSQGKTIYDVAIIRQAARIGAELGGDMIKTAYAGTSEQYKQVVKSCPAPIVVMGGPKMESALDLLKMVKDSIDSGAIGGAIGRNIWQYKDPVKITRAASSIIHQNTTLEEASRQLK